MENKFANSLPKMLPGAVCPQWKKCGRQNCQCSRGLLHGPYFYRFYRVAGRLRKQYVKRNELADVTSACAQHRIYRAQLRFEANYSEAKLRELKAKAKALLEQMSQTL